MIPNTCSAVLLPLVFTYVKDEIRIAIWESLGYFPSEYIKELHGIKNTSAKHFFFFVQQLGKNKKPGWMPLSSHSDWNFYRIWQEVDYC